MFFVTEYINCSVVNYLPIMLSKEHNTCYNHNTGEFITERKVNYTVNFITVVHMKKILHKMEAFTDTFIIKVDS